MFSRGTGALASIASCVIRKLLSGWSCGTKRSSPQYHDTRRHGKRPRNSSEASNSKRVLGVDPPERDTRKSPVAASAAAVIHSATWRASVGGSGNISTRPIALPMGLLFRAVENEPLHRLRETLVVERVRGRASLRLDLVGGIAHGNAQTRPLEHHHVIWLITDRGDLLGRDIHAVREIGNDGALVGVLVGDVEIVRLRPVGGRPLPECRLGLGFAALHFVAV